MVYADTLEGQMLALHDALAAVVREIQKAALADLERLFKCLNLT